MIQLIDVTKAFKNNVVLDEISMDFRDGELTVLIGPSGCGKTTTLKMINRLIPATGGRILIDGEDIESIDKVKLRRNMGYVIQQGGLFPHMTIRQNIEIIEKLEGKDEYQILKNTERLMEMVDMDAGKFLDRYPSELSGGQQQRVAIARALVNEPKVLLLDEPLGALDAKIRKQMQIELKKIQREVGITFIYVTHDQEEALSMSDTVVVMNNGEIQQIGSPTDIYNEPENRFVAGFIGESNIIEGTMIRDYLVAFDGFEFECVDKGFEDNEEIEVVLRPEDLDIVDPGQAKIRGIVRNITFKGVHYEILIETELRTYMVHTTDYAEVGREVGLKFGPEDIHVMCKMGSY